MPPDDSFQLLKDIYKISDSDFKNTREKLIDALDLSQIIYIPTRQLSLGQRMRCEIAASLLHNPKILFLDEPTIGLDAVSKISVRKFIKDINKENNTTVILTTHDMQDIEALTNRIMLIGKGELLYNGNLEDIKKRYSKEYKILVEYEYTDLPLQLYDVDIIEHTEQSAVLSFNTNIIKMPDVLNQLSNQVHLLDVDVISSPIEEVIANMYSEMKI